MHVEWKIDFANSFAREKMIKIYLS